jgi:hypothetical protein
MSAASLRPRGDGNQPELGRHRQGVVVHPTLHDPPVPHPVEGGQEAGASAEGNGPVHALDTALRAALERFHPELARVRLVDYKVRVLNAEAATAARVRVLITSADGLRHWGTVGVSENVVLASAQALADSLEYALLVAASVPAG